MEYKTAEETLKESMKHLDHFKRMWPRLDTQTAQAVHAAFIAYASQAVRLALEEAAADVTGATNKLAILSLEDSIIGKLK
jgi:hypothetical protein